MDAYERIIVALDVNTAQDALDLSSELNGAVGAYKIGKELFTAQGPDVVRSIISSGGRVFLDLKYHDIPNTVKGACRAAAGLGVWMVNVHAAGGGRMIAAASTGAGEGDGPRPIVLAVTVLTSIDEQTLRNEMRVPFTPMEQVVYWARLAQDNGADGVVCSPLEIEAVREACGPDFTIVTPGIRPVWASTDDQKRITTPSQAVERGADYMVIGRPITKSDDRRGAAVRIAEELA